ncbi:MAG: bacteriohemerythrin [Bdellovibrionaceae bacterium]|mgnify:CR=1 FL=1|jgi:hemerythrin-like metal-binding protein|nr:bacteriohemerythrin [Pseudobdellovibrionaceae bacterium]
MSLIEWGDEYKIGMDSIDKQHEKLVDYINQLHAGMMEGKGAEVMGPILTGLVAYTKSHFQFEEMLFASHKYENEAEHKEYHKKLVDQVVDFQTKFKAGEATISDELMDFLKDWLISHIQGEDVKYVEYLKGKGVQ